MCTGFDTRLAERRLQDATKAFFGASDDDSDDESPESVNLPASDSPSDQATDNSSTAAPETRSPTTNVPEDQPSTEPNMRRPRYRLAKITKMYDRMSWAPAFVSLFPFGRGHPGELIIDSMSLCSYVQHTLQLSHTTFASCHEHVLVAFDTFRSSAGSLPGSIRASTHRDSIMAVPDAQLRQAIELNIRRENDEDVAAQMDALP